MCTAADACEQAADQRLHAIAVSVAKRHQLGTTSQLCHFATCL